MSVNLTLSFACCPANGTLLNTFCVGYTLWGTYANGSCGTYDAIIEYNSSSCGFSGCTTYSYGTFGFDFYYDCNGVYQYQYLSINDTRCIDNNNPPGSSWSSTFNSCI